LRSDITPLGVGKWSAFWLTLAPLKRTHALTESLSDNPMLRILYFSQATNAVTPDQIRDILESSQRNNAAAGITGVLIHGGGLFMQVLEGPENAVLRLYVKILDDRRHSNGQLIHISPVSERMFESWSMGVLDSSPVEFRHIAELRSLRLESVGSKAFANVMHTFVKRLNGGS
jgi:hypothetical protein